MDVDRSQTPEEEQVNMANTGSQRERGGVLWLKLTEGGRGRLWNVDQRMDQSGKTPVQMQITENFEFFPSY